jgi:hypothetical protein
MCGNGRKNVAINSAVKHNLHCDENRNKIKIADVAPILKNLMPEKLEGSTASISQSSSQTLGQNAPKLRVSIFCNYAERHRRTISGSSNVLEKQSEV